MISETEDDRLILRYLLGNLTDVERDRFEELYFTDEALFDKLLVAEDELIDRYVRGGLSGLDRELFEKNFLASPRHCERVEFAKIMLKSPSSSQTDIRSAFVRRKPSLLGSFSSFWRAQNRVFQFALGIIVLLMVLGTTWLIIKNTWPWRSIPQQEVLFNLAPLNVRGINETPVLNLPPEVKRVQLKLHFERGTYNTYRVLLQNAAGVSILEEAGLKAGTSGTEKVLGVVINSDLLAAGTYFLTLSGEADKDHTDLLSEYQFKIVK